MVSFAAPHALWLLILPGIAAVFALRRHRHRVRQQRGLASPGVWDRLMGGTPATGLARLGFWIVAGALLAVALARPQWGELPAEESVRTRDLALVIDADFGLVVILGCAHRGIVNTLRHAQNLTGKELVYAAIGGTHLFRAPDEQLRHTIAELKGMGLQRLGVSHCTGFRASALLAQEFGDSFFLNNAGTRLTLP